jgi:hypothetical protein
LSKVRPAACAAIRALAPMLMSPVALFMLTP